MPCIEIHYEANDKFFIQVEGWLKSHEEKKHWRSIVRKLVLFAFEGKPATLITISPMEWSIGYEMPEHKVIKTRDIEYLIGNVSICSEDLLTKLVDSADFQRGLLFITEQNINNTKYLIQEIRKYYSDSANSRTTNEILYMQDDGHSVNLINPSININKLTHKIMCVAEILGWFVKIIKINAR